MSERLCERGFAPKSKGWGFLSASERLLCAALYLGHRLGQKSTFLVQSALVWLQGGGGAVGRKQLSQLAC